jgi:hypothetical protein
MRPCYRNIAAARFGRDPSPAAEGAREPAPQRRPAMA